MVVSNRSDKNFFFLDLPRLKVSGGSLERRPKSSSEDDLQWHPPFGLFKAWGMDLLGRPCSDL